jgi:beta-lactamase class A
VRKTSKLLAGLLALVLFMPQLQVANASADTNLKNSINAYLAMQPGSYSVTALEIGGAGREIQINDRKSHDPASVFKLFYALMVLEKVQLGTWSLNTRIGSNESVSICLKMMLSYSDNQCTQDFRKKLGNKFVNARLKDLGFVDSRISTDTRGNYVTKRTSTRDVAKLLVGLERGQLLNQSNTSRFKEYLKGQIWRARISSALQAGTQVASKSGQLLTPAGMIEADSAIVYGPTSTYVLVVLGNNGASGSVIRGVSDLVYRQWQGPIIRHSNYSSAQMVTSKKASFRATIGGRLIKVLPANTAVTVKWTVRGWAYVKVGSTKGYLNHTTLKLSSRYLRWGTP